VRAAFGCAPAFARGDARSGSVPVIDHQNVGYMLADLKCRIEAVRYLTCKACHDLDHHGAAGQEFAIATRIFSSELCVWVV
jgi:alkylation response protein AidB-like acyl-CoA dehydrogenase